MTRTAEIADFPPDALLDLDGLGLDDLDVVPPGVLAAAMRRAFNPGDRDKLTVSAFGSAL